MIRCFWSTPKSTFVCNLYINKALIQEQSVEKGWVLEGGGPPSQNGIIEFREYLFRCLLKYSKIYILCEIYIQRRHWPRNKVLNGGWVWRRVSPSQSGRKLNSENVYMSSEALQNPYLCVHWTYKEGLYRGTKCRGGYGRVHPLPEWKNILFRECLDVFWSTPKSTLIILCA